MEKVIAVIGTNASGKSDLGVQLARKYGGEIISADSRQVFKGLDLGTGKITPQEMQGIPHHMIDIREPGEFFSMADFQQISFELIPEIARRGHLPMIVGGTGLYIDSVLDGYNLSDAEPDLAYRAELETHTTPELYEMLTRIIPEPDVDPKNRNRVMRMLERIQKGDTHVPTKTPRYESLRLGVSWPREILYERIDQRLRRRFDEGMEGEIRGLLAKGVDPEFLIGLGLEYRFITWYVTGKITDFDEMYALLAQAIRKFSKRQMTWFKRNPDVIWLKMQGNPFDEACAAIDRFLAS